MEIQVTRCSSFEKTTQKELFAYATFTTVDGKRKLTDISLTWESIRQIIDQSFIKSGKKSLT